jgi:hypothetical protein
MEQHIGGQEDTMIATFLIHCSCCGGEQDFTAVGLPEELNLTTFAEEFASRLQCSECGSSEFHTECEQPTLH